MLSSPVTMPGNPFRFTGREDDGTGLLFYRSRYQDPGVGRFISQDLLSQDSRGLGVRVDPTALLGGAAVAPTPSAASVLGGYEQVGGYRYVDSSPMSGRDPRGTIIPMVIGLGIAGLLLIPHAQDYGETMGEMYYRPLPAPSGVVHTQPTPPSTTTTPTTTSADDERVTRYEAYLDQQACAGMEGTGYGGC